MGSKKKTGKERLDKYYKLAKEQGYRSRSAFKLLQLEKKYHFLKKASIVVDLCGAPGGWSQVASKEMSENSKVVCVDLIPIKPIRGAICIQGDITTTACRNDIIRALDGRACDVVLNDGAPNVGSAWNRDAYNQSELTIHAFRLAAELLRPNGVFITKVFRSTDYNSILWAFQQLFSFVTATKPAASRQISAEIFVICRGFKAPAKVDPRLFDPKFVFMEIEDNQKLNHDKEKEEKEKEKEDIDDNEFKNEDSIINKMEFNNNNNNNNSLLKSDPFSIDEIRNHINTLKKLLKPLGCPSAINDHLDTSRSKARGGYNDTSVFKFQSLPVSDYIYSMRPADLLVRSGNLSFIKPECHLIRERLDRGKKDFEIEMKAVSPLMDDIQVLGKTDLYRLLKWRNAVIRHLLVEASKGLDSRDLEVAKEGDGEGGDESDAEGVVDKVLSDLIAKKNAEKKSKLKKLKNAEKTKISRMKRSIGVFTGESYETDLFASFPTLPINSENVEKIGVSSDDSVYSSDMDLDSEEDTEDSEKKNSNEYNINNSNEYNTSTSLLHPSNGTDDKRLDKIIKGVSEVEIIREYGISNLIDQVDKDETTRNEFLGKLVKRKSLNGITKGEKKVQKYQREATERLDGIEDREERNLQNITIRKNNKEISSSYDNSNESDFSADSFMECKVKNKNKNKKNMNLLVDDSNVTDNNIQETFSERDMLMAERWFSNPIFSSLTSVDKNRDMNKSDVDGDCSVETSMPLTDKQKRHLKRKKETERRERINKSKNSFDAEINEMSAKCESIQLVPQELQSLDEIEKPSDPKSLTEIQSLGYLLTKSKKSRQELIEASYNRFSFSEDHDECLPGWFLEEEKLYSKIIPPITKAMSQEIRKTEREINARPIKKVAEAAYRKKKRREKTIEKLRKVAVGLAAGNLGEKADGSEASSSALRMMKKAVGKSIREEDKYKLRPVYKVVTGRGAPKTVSKGSGRKGKTKMVDRRLKTDIRAKKRNQKKMKKRR